MHRFKTGIILAISGSFTLSVATSADPMKSHRDGMIAVGLFSVIVGFYWIVYGDLKKD